MAGPGRPRKTVQVEDVAQVTLFDEDDEDLEGIELDEIDELGYDVSAPAGDYVGEEEELYDPDELEDDEDEIDEYLYPAFRTITTSFDLKRFAEGGVQEHARNIAYIIKAGQYRVVDTHLVVTGSGDNLNYVYWVSLARDW